MNADSVTTDRTHSFLLVVLLFFVGMKYIYNLPEYTDIKLWDESIYLHNGRTLLSRGLPDVNYAPVYAVYSYVLSLFQGEAIAHYYLNYYILTVLMPIVSYVFFTAFGVKKIPAFILSIFMLMSPVNYNQGFLGQKVSLFALYMLMMSFVWIKYLENIEHKLILSCLSSFVVSFVRPEIMLTFLLLFFIFIGYSITCWVKTRNSAGLNWCVGIFCFVMIVYAVMGLPMISKGEGRSIIAFGQHFSYNWVGWTGSKMDPWTNWDKIFAESFGSARTIREAATINPAMFLKHVIHNMTSFGVNFLNLIKYYDNLILPKDFSTWSDIFTVMILAITPIIRFSYCRVIDHLQKIKIDYVLVVYAVTVIIPGVLSCIVIYPRNHYLLPLFVLAMTCLGLMISCTSTQSFTLKHHVLYGTMFLMGVPCLGDLKSERPYLENKNVIYAIRNLHLTGKINLMEVDGGYSLYQATNFNWVKPFGKQSEFDVFMRDNNVNMIVVSDKLIGYHKLSSDEKWKRFISEYKEYGFVRVDVPGSSKYILIHKSILKG